VAVDVSVKGRGTPTGAPPLGIEGLGIRPDLAPRSQGIAGVDNEHLAILSKIAIIFSDETEAKKMLEASIFDELYQLLGDVNAE